VAECLLNKCKARVQNPSVAKKKKKSEEEVNIDFLPCPVKGRLVAPSVCRICSADTLGTEDRALCSPMFVYPGWPCSQEASDGSVSE
jgi:hypothetical protein